MKTIHLPLEEAISLAAKENFARDLRVGCIDAAESMDIYIEEARHLLTTTGENYEPEFEDHHMIFVKA